MASREFVHERCFVAQVQHKDTHYDVSIPYGMCEKQQSDIDSVLKCVQHAHPHPDLWDPHLKMFNFVGAAWTARDAHLLPQQLYICLAQSGIQ